MSDRGILEKAIQKAIDGGWSQGIAWMDIVVNNWIKFEESEGLPALIFNHDFAKALWGKDLLSQRGHDFGAIRFYAEQIAFDIQDKIIAIDRKRNRHSYELVKGPDINLLDYESIAPTELVESEKFIMQVKDMAAAIPFRTHRLAEVDSIDGIPAWQYHLQQMVIADDPIKYLGESI